MRKRFTEPMIRRIELNLNENIANSAGGMVEYRVQLKNINCIVFDSGYTWLQAMTGEAPEACLSNCVKEVSGLSKMAGVYVSRNELFGY